MKASVLTADVAELVLRESDGQLTPADAQRLSAWLSASESNVLAYVEFAQLQAGLEWERNAANGTPPLSAITVQQASLVRLPESSRPGVSRSSFRFNSLAAMLLVAVVYYGAALVLFWGIGAPQAGRPTYDVPVAASAGSGTDREPIDTVDRRTTLARCIEESNCVWQSTPASRLTLGSRLNLLSGVARLQFADGATVALQGPAAFEVASAGSGMLSQGKLTALVPPRAHGFTIDTPSLRVIDLGTEFGVSVRADGSSQVHVFSGKVDTRTNSGGVLGEAVRLGVGDAMEVTDSRQAGSQPVVAQFKADRSLFAANPAKPISATLLGFYPLDGDGNDASGNGKHALKVSDVEFVPGKEGQAAMFGGLKSSFIDLPIDASANAVPDLTWGAWVKVPREVTTRSEILSTDNMNFARVLTIDNRVGASPGETFRFAAMGGPAVGVVPLRQVPVPVNEWRFVAAVYRRENKLVMIYGEDPTLDRGRGGLASTFGTAEIGSSANWIRVGCHPHGHEPFAGAIDNVFIFRGALGHPELEQIRSDGAARILEFNTGR